MYNIPGLAVAEKILNIKSMARSRHQCILIVILSCLTFTIMLVSWSGDDLLSNVPYIQGSLNLKTVDLHVRPNLTSFVPLNNPSALRNVKRGGEYRPPNGTSRDITAIIIPYRDRQEHRKVFLQHMHAYLQKQNIHYMIFFVEMMMPTTFNRGLLINVGFSLAEQLRNFTCYVFHDVDLLPADDANRYVCDRNIHHFSVNNSKFDYKLPYPGYAGGVVAFPGQLFRQINGFSNAFFGWGGEDDDMLDRISASNLELKRPKGAAIYHALDHDKDKGNPINEWRFGILECKTSTWQKDGLNSLRYTEATREAHALYTWILIRVKETTVMKTVQFDFSCMHREQIRTLVRLFVCVVIIVVVVNRRAHIKQLVSKIRTGEITFGIRSSYMYVKDEHTSSNVYQRLGRAK